jgi:IS30 family transposase
MYLREMSTFPNSVQKKNNKSKINQNSTLANFEFLARETSFESIREMKLYQERLKACLDNIFKICKLEKLNDSEKARILHAFSEIQKNPNSKDLGIIYRIKMNLAKYSLVIKSE